LMETGHRTLTYKEQSPAPVVSHCYKPSHK
jgi:hypothetical protein